MTNKIKPSEAVKGHPDDDMLAEYMRMYKQSQHEIRSLRKDVQIAQKQQKKHREQYLLALAQLEKFVEASQILVDAGYALVEETKEIPVLDRPEMEKLRQHRAVPRTPRYRKYG